MNGSVNQPEYANMSSASLSALNKSRPPASPPLHHAPAPPPPPTSKPPHLHPSGHPSGPGSHRSFVRSPSTNTTITMATPTPSDDIEILTQLSREELVSRILSLEQKNRKLLFDNGAMMKDINMHLSQLQQLKHQNFQLLGDNNELRDLCCYLDDERSKARSVAREWQSFGNHMSRVMRHEVTQYSTKLSQLETKQFELVRENFELKQLCLLLDNAISVRENGDGSTGSMASNGEENSHQEEQNNNNNTNQTLTGSAAQRQHHRVIISQQILEYIRSLEEKIRQLEWEKKRRDQRASGLPANAEQMDSYQNQHDTGVQCPPAVAEAMRVLRIHDSMNDDAAMAAQNGNGTGSKKMSKEEEFSLEQQRAIVRSLCNVAWRKIEDGS